MNDEPERAPVILDPSGRPARKRIDRRCPTCQSSRRRRSSGFGDWHDICADCGHDFEGERTADA